MTGLLRSLRSHRRKRRVEVADTGDVPHTSHNRVLRTLAGLALLCFAFLRLSSRVVVDGPSMLPTLAPGDRLLVRKVATFRLGDLVVFEDPDGSGRLLVKRIAELNEHGVDVRGDNAGASRDGREFGPLSRTAIKGIAWYRYWPSDAAGRLARPVVI